VTPMFIVEHGLYLLLIEVW